MYFQIKFKIWIGLYAFGYILFVLTVQLTTVHRLSNNELSLPHDGLTLTNRLCKMFLQNCKNIWLPDLKQRSNLDRAIRVV